MLKALVPFTCTGAVGFGLSGPVRVVERSGFQRWLPWGWGWSPSRGPGLCLGLGWGDTEYSGLVLGCFSGTGRTLQVWGPVPSPLSHSEGYSSFWSLHSTCPPSPALSGPCDCLTDNFPLSAGVGGALAAPLASDNLLFYVLYFFYHPPTSLIPPYFPFFIQFLLSLYPPLTLSSSLFLFSVRSNKKKRVNKHNQYK